MEKFAFVCTHNSCRSQIAEALGRRLRGDEFEFYSAGTEPSAQVNVTAVRLMRERSGVDLGGYAPKDLSARPPVDVVVTMGCGVQRPLLPCKRREGWGLPDPEGMDDEGFLAVIAQIECEVRKLVA